jgi:hypothetical protein
MAEESQEKQYPQLPGQIPDFLRNDLWYETDISGFLLDFTEQYKPPRYTLSWNGVPFAPLGGIQNITGQAGYGKTMTIAQFMAAILKGEFGGLRYELSEEIPHPRLLYIDTEMEKYNIIAVKNRVLSMAGRDINKEYDDFHIMMLREVPDGKQAAKDKNGNLLPDDVRLNKYGRILRSTSLDELPELINIFIGNMSIIGPRPLLVEYLPYYTLEERHRHDVRPGLTGWAQVNGRNALNWDARFEKDVEYVKSISVFMDIKILFMTVFKVLKRSDVSDNTAIAEGNMAKIRQQEQEKNIIKNSK